MNTETVNPEKTVLNLLEQAGGKLTAEDDIVRTDDRTIAIPQTMSLTTARDFLTEKIREDEEFTSFSQTYPFRPWDGAMATYRALKKVFGMVKLSGKGWNSPSMVTIPIGPDQTAEVPWGELTIPLLPDVQFSVDAGYSDELGTVFQLSAYGPRNRRHAINGVFAVVGDALQSESIYRGKAFNGKEQPDFIDVDAVDPEKIVYATETAEQLEANVWALLRYSPQHRTIGLPLKRAILLEGPYGTGKTVGATLTAQIAVANGWTFINCRPGRDDVANCMATAKMYQPAVVFVEDVDTISDPENIGTDGVTRLLDLFDGVSSKGTEIIVVMTTNHADRIHKGMTRPGRVDSVIHVGELDAASIQKLIQVHIPAENLAAGIDWQSVTESMHGYLPAYIKEAVDRAKRYNLSRNQGMITLIGTDDLVAAANGLRPQLELMNAAPESATVDPLAQAFGSVMSDTVRVPFEETQTMVAASALALHEENKRTPRKVRQILSGMAITDDDGDVMYRLDADE